MNKKMFGLLSFRIKIFVFIQLRNVLYEDNKLSKISFPEVSYTFSF